MIDYTDAHTIERQNMSPNAGCTIDGEFYDVRNLLHEIARLTASLIEANREAVAKIAEATEAKMKAEAALSESQALLAMAFEAAAQEADEHRHFAKGIECCGDCIRALTPADAQAALAARIDAAREEGRIIGLRELADEFNLPETQGIHRHILAKIKEVGHG